MRLYFGGLTRRGSDEWEWQGIVAASDARAAKALLRRSCKGLVPCIMPSGGPWVRRVHDKPVVPEGAAEAREEATVKIWKFSSTSRAYACRAGGLPQLEGDPEVEVTASRPRARAVLEPPDGKHDWHHVSEVSQFDPESSRLRFSVDGAWFFVRSVWDAARAAWVAPAGAPGDARAKRRRR